MTAQDDVRRIVEIALRALEQYEDVREPVETAARAVEANSQALREAERYLPFLEALQEFTTSPAGRMRGIQTLLFTKLVDSRAQARATREAFDALGLDEKGAPGADLARQYLRAVEEAEPVPAPLVGEPQDSPSDAELDELIDSVAPRDAETDEQEADYVQAAIAVAILAVLFTTLVLHPEFLARGLEFWEIWDRAMTIAGAARMRFIKRGRKDSTDLAASDETAGPQPLAAASADAD